jgi:hypothetical protein
VLCGLQECIALCGLHECIVLCGLQECIVLCGLQECDVLCGLQELSCCAACRSAVWLAGVHHAVQACRSHWHCACGVLHLHHMGSLLPSGAL